MKNKAVYMFLVVAVGCLVLGCATAKNSQTVRSNDEVFPRQAFLYLPPFKKSYTFIISNLGTFLERRITVWERGDGFGEGIAEMSDGLLGKGPEDSEWVVVRWIMSREKWREYCETLDAMDLWNRNPQNGTHKAKGTPDNDGGRWLSDMYMTDKENVYRKRAVFVGLYPETRATNTYADVAGFMWDSVPETPFGWSDALPEGVVTGTWMKYDPMLRMMKLVVSDGKRRLSMLESFDEDDCEPEPKETKIREFPVMDFWLTGKTNSTPVQTTEPVSTNAPVSKNDGK